MIDRIIDFSINNKFIIGLLTLALIGAGTYSMTQVPIDAVPDITNNQVQVITQSPNLGTEDIEQFVTYPVEVAMSNLPSVKEIRSISRFGLSVVTIVFDDKMGTYLPRQLVSEKLTEVREAIPEGFGQPSIGPITTGLGEVYQYTLKVESEFQDKYSLTDLRTMQDWIVQRQMAMVPGVVEINAIGGKIKQYEVAVNPNDLKAIGLTITDVFKALESNNKNTGGAYIEKNHQANFIRGEGLVRSLDDIKKIVIKNENGVPVTVSDVAEVRFGSAVRYGALTQDGEGEVVGGLVMMLKGANSNEVIVRVKERMAEIQKSLPEGVIIEPLLDRSKLINETTGTVRNNLLEGALIVIFVLVFLLGNWRGGLIVASTIPLSLLFAFILMNVFDVWANLMSLGAIDFGIIVDGAVIIVEASVFLMGSYLLKKKALNRADRDEIAANASKKMMNAAFFGQLIILIVFLPILALEGVEGKMFRPMALTFIFAMIGAMVLCLTYVPMMSALFLKPPKTKKKTWGDRFVLWVQRKYEPLLVNALKKGKWVVGIAVALFAVATFVFSRMGGEFIPQLDEGDIAFHTILKPGSSLSETIETTTKVERIVMAEFPEVEKIVSRIGVAEVPTDPMPMDFADVFVILKPRDEWVSAASKDELIAKMKEAVSIIPGVNYEFTQPIEMRFNELLEGIREDVAIKIYGEDIDVLASKADEITQIIAGTDGIGDMRAEATSGLPQMTIKYNRDKLAQYGVSIDQLNMMVQSAFAGGYAGVIFEGEKRFDLVVRLHEQNRSDINDIRKLYISLPNGSQIPLQELAAIEYIPGPMQISRDNTNRRTYVGVNVRGRDVESLVNEIKDKLDANLDLPPGYFIRYGGAFENLERASERLQTVVPVALLLIFILIYFALKSFPQSLMIYLAIPMATIGGVFALWLRDMPFSISAGVGFIVLFGVAVLNGLVMISGFNELKQEGVADLNVRILEGTKRRVRPIMLTAFTDILGFLPMAISGSAGAEVQRPLATVVIGGLISSTLLTLLILPIFYQWVENRSERERKLNSKLVSAMAVAGLLFTSTFAKAQQEQDSLPIISIEQAGKIARENYPLLKTKQLEIQKQNTLKGTAYDLGKTQVFTGGEEVGDGQGIYTIVGIGQQSINLFGIGAKRRLQKQRIALAETAHDLTGLQVEQEAKKAWSQAYQQRQKYELYRELDSIYALFEKAVELNFEVEAISRLEYASAINQALQISNKLQQAESDYLIALQKLNLWLVSDTYYTVPGKLDEREIGAVSLDVDLAKHPELALSQKRIDEAEANYRVARTDLLPNFNLQGGLQQVSGENGFYTYQAGLSLPLFSGTLRSEAKAAKIDSEIAREQANFIQRQLQSEYRQAVQTHQKWKTSWQFYRDKALPLAGEQRIGALLAYTEGAVDYAAFTQIIRDAINTEMEALNTLDNYLKSVFELQYFNQ
ncbi:MULTISPECIES: CusA/CzcA family heavy metal efflux RND transporter [Robiginitalea]|uniref:Putative transport-related, membrane protein n=1 Tax=Robiginitalea biformata (strain ATCC BAA-864 / DSM 15991 / KCTC 12146 / HTCC2501) TaxID=313596 RepID=A4CH05_ROBBH|nr:MULTISPECIES: CusA/CzcA family heavy metal efflux RND transporter [Robiginitalea]EAR16213.1 putative transport-related, membrane protein [Robiginitalea biformata HTCC2501]MDC6353511.1 CusA/CzcA family heavy metal efflux RND transporter [Robiginitalea sp. PM2]MDC6373324.1 CusA/CzcA family heavy metal efflux RND transporter [Robiginitalea sp. SP8]